MCCSFYLKFSFAPEKTKLTSENARKLTKVSLKSEILRNIEAKELGGKFKFRQRSILPDIHWIKCQEGIEMREEWKRKRKSVKYIHRGNFLGVAFADVARILSSLLWCNRKKLNVLANREPLYHHFLLGRVPVLRIWMLLCDIASGNHDFG